MLSFGFRIFCWYRGFCHRTGSDLLLFLFKPPRNIATVLTDAGKLCTLFSLHHCLNLLKYTSYCLFVLIQGHLPSSKLYHCLKGGMHDKTLSDIQPGEIIITIQNK